jgi:hypothetical protein
MSNMLLVKIDVIEALVGGERPRKYWNDLKKKLLSEGYIEVADKIGQLKLPAPDGKLRETDCAETETIFRIIQSVPSPKVEPLKRWLACVGKERLDKIENPELATIQRMKEIYEKKGTRRIGSINACGALLYEKALPMNGIIVGPRLILNMRF